MGFEFDGAHFFIGGHALERSRKYKNVANGQRLVSLIIDDLETIKPWRPRGIKIHGCAEIVQRQGQFGAGAYLAVTPLVSWSWGIEEDSFTDGKFTPKKIIWTADETL